MDKIEVRDNGSGISKEAVSFAARPHFTSKLATFSDLSCLQSYGFRGEGLSSIAAVANLSITTRTEEDEVAMTYTMDHSGQVISSKPSAASCGTTVCVTNLFSNVPVRKQYYKSSKVTKEDFRKCESTLLAFGLANPSIRFALKHNKSLIWQKFPTKCFRNNVGIVLGSQTLQQLVAVDWESPIVKFSGFVPSSGADPALVFRTSPERMFLLVNRRPVVIKPVMQVW